MPNQRKEGKKIVSTWMSKPDRKRLESIAKANGKNKSDVTKAAILSFNSLPETKQRSWISKLND